MRTNVATTLLATGFSLMTAPALAEKPPLQLAERGARVDLVRIAKVKVIDGKVRLDGGWVECVPFQQRAAAYCLWDCYGRHWGPGSDETPDSAPDCSIGGSSRWYFGSGYYNPYTEDDVGDAVAGPVSEIDWAWLWEPPEPSPLYALFFWNSGSDVNDCVPAPYLGDLGAVIADYGLVSPSAPDYLYSAIDVTPLNLVFPADTIRSHSVALAQHSIRPPAKRHSSAGRPS